MLMGWECANGVFTVRPVRGHFEVLVNGKFFCSADNEREAELEIINSRENFHEQN